MQFSLIATIIIFVAIIFGIAFLLTMKADTLPLAEGFAAAATTENFADATLAPGVDGGSRILSALESVCAADEYKELKLLLAKMAAFKADLQSTSGTMNATMYIPLIASQDREQVANTVARCLAKTIPPRELGFILELWKERGMELISSLVKKADVANEAAITELFAAAMNDISSVANTMCLGGEPIINKKPVSPRDYTGIIPDVGSPYMS
jgi:hypothetical protein